MIINCTGDRNLDGAIYRGWFDHLLCLLYPDRCLLCRSILVSGNIRPFCSFCNYHGNSVSIVCPLCDKVFFGAVNKFCCSEKLPFQGLIALTRYDRKWRSLIHKLKFKKHRFLARSFGHWLGFEILHMSLFRPQLVVPVPLHPHREAERGFNQSALLACYTARVLKVPAINLLIKEKHTRSQTNLSRSERYENVHNVFKCTRELPKDTPVLLVDDIYSTGATMKEAAKALQEKGAVVYGAVIAYNPRNN